ncbi:hypothetical protein AA309_25120 [Microvirga vignae]|uniref:Uncharacterized protein n=1 Tax=Microvirga vignae TaxID=1225564 RepID=A0A0H1R6T9_9HYPH|nr:hypothetical protein AA309_25120 [Microvirga vignae]
MPRCLGNPPCAYRATVPVRHAVALGEDVLDRDMQIRKHGLERLNVLLDPLEAKTRSRRMVEEVVRDLLIDGSGIEVVRGRLVVCPDQGLVAVRLVRHEGLSCWRCYINEV